MTKVLKLFHGSTEKMDLQTGDAAGYQLKSWSPAIARPAYGRDADDVEEKMPITVEGSNHNDLATKLQTFHEVQRLAEQYRVDRTVDDPVWLHCQLKDESGLRRALVKEISGDFPTSWYGATGIANKAEVSMVVRRAPYWERDSSRKFPDSGNIGNALSFDYDYTAAGAGISAHDIVGDVGARIQHLVLQCQSSAVEIDRLWIGIRSANKHGTLTNFAHVWEAEDGQNNASESGITDVSDGSCSGGYKVRVVETDLEWDDTWHEVYRIDMSDVTVNESDNFGTFLWLLRGNVSAGTWEVRLRWGYHEMAEADLTVGRVVEIDSTNEDAYEMDVFRIPHRDIRSIRTSDVSADAEGNFQIRVFARRTSGSGNLEIDALVPIPIDEGFLKVWDFTLDYTGDPPHDHMDIGESPEGTWYIATRSGAGIWEYIPTFEADNFRLPAGNGTMIIAMARDDSWPLVAQMIVADGDDGAYYERWCSLRGSE